LAADQLAFLAAATGLSGWGAAGSGPAPST